ncbi:MAG: HEPN domain-containing protein [Candidatus Bathyarchaeota archaeon]|nr:HEPN domain-containing protein [Candidatus Bathyarchaeota archaeon]
MNPRLDEIKEWLQKAKNDLVSAQILIKHDPPVLDTASFHCQQAVEKALKAFLVWKGVSFEKVHSLTYFLDLCEAQEPRFGSLRERAEALAPYAVEIRYPGAVMEVTPNEAQEALAAAEALWNFVINLLPEEVKSTK